MVKLALIAFYIEGSESFMVLDKLFSRIFIKLLGWAKHIISRHFKVNPRPAGVWLVTHPAGGGGAKGPPEISQTTVPISKFQTPFDSPVRELPVQGKKFDPEVTDDVTGQVKVRTFDFSGLVTSASKILMLSANKANESAWMVSLTSVSIISCAL